MALSRLPLARGLRPAWFDEARLIVQGPQLSDVLGARPVGGRVLNAGCGEGLYAPFLERFPDVRAIVNVDLARPSVARNHTDRRHRDLQASLTRLPFASGSFDAVLCSEVLEHIPDDEAAVAELSRVLARGGLLLVSVPTPPAPLDRAHVREGYTREALARLFARHDLEMIDVRYCMHAFMRSLYVLWQWQHGETGRNLFPRAALRAFARADVLTRAGRPWDLVALASRRG
jgi:SAM-dependent methyltransferase